MRIAVAGATGQVGDSIVRKLLAEGHAVAALGRRPSRHGAAIHLPFELGADPPGLDGFDALVHAALAHVPGKYRGGEGGDPRSFMSLNVDGTVRLFEAARRADVSRIVFLSSRAVYGGYPPGTALGEDMAPMPDTLYGRAKAEAEAALRAMRGRGLAVASLRATGVYGPPLPGIRHKWEDIFRAFAGGEPVTPRASTEVRAEDVAAAVSLLAQADAAALEPAAFNASDFVLDRRDLLEILADVAGVRGVLPERVDRAPLSVMATDRLRALGWRPGGQGDLPEVAAAVAAQAGLLAPGGVSP